MTITQSLSMKNRSDNPFILMRQGGLICRRIRLNLSSELPGLLSGCVQKRLTLLKLEKSAEKAEDSAVE